MFVNSLRDIELIDPIQADSFFFLPSFLLSLSLRYIIGRDLSGFRRLLVVDVVRDHIRSRTRDADIVESISLLL